MKKTRVLTTILALSVIVTMFAGCQNTTAATGTTKESTTGDTGGAAAQDTTTAQTTGEKPTIVLSRWAGPHADDQKTVLAKYPDAIVKVDDIDYGNLKQKQIQSMSSSADYDLVWAQEIWMPEYISKGWLMPLDEFVAKDKVDLSIYSPAMVDMNKVDGKLYAMPTFAQTLILTYNKEWFEKEGQKVPTTVDELIAVAKYFKEKGTGIAIPAGQGQPSADIFAQFLYSAGGDYFDKDGKINLTSPEALYAANLWDELCEYSIDGSLTWQHDQVSQAIREEQAPFGITVTGLSGQDSMPDVSKIVDKVGYAVIPGSKLVSGCVSYWSWAVAANSKNPEAAFKVAAWLTSAEVEKEQAMMNGQISAVSSLADDAEIVAKIPYLPATNETLKNAKTQPTSASATAIFEPLAAALSEIASSDKPSADIFAGLQEQLKDVTNK